jgi:adenylate cyclase
LSVEIERKFLVQDDSWRSDAQGVLLRQGYLPTQGKGTVRVRVAGEKAYLTIKGPTEGLVRSEFEYPIPLADATSLLASLCQGPLIEKYRYRIPVGDLVWEVDEFLGANQGLVVAEVELTSPDQPLNLPAWVGQEVSDDPRYRNSNLVQHPFTLWRS